MKLILWLLVLALGGCSVNQASFFEKRLNDYAIAAATRNEDLGNHLTGSALESALETREFLLELGLTQLGVAVFSEVVMAGQNQVTGCLDVSKVSFLDANQKLMDLSGRLERQKVLATFEDGDHSHRLSELEVGLGSC